MEGPSLGEKRELICATDEALTGAGEDLGAGTRVATDAHLGYARVLPALGIAEGAATRTDLQRDGELGMVNALHQRLRSFLAGFHGVSTRRLDHYLSWFVWLEQARCSHVDRLQSLSRQAAAGSYENTRRQLIDRPSPSGTTGAEGDHINGGLIESTETKR